MGTGDGKSTEDGKSPEAGKFSKTAMITNEYMQQTTELIKNMSVSMVMGQMSFVLQGIRHFDGSNISLNDFIQDIRNGVKHVAKQHEPQYVSAVIAKLRGAARDCVSGKEISVLENLIKILKKRFAPGHDYAYYLDKITSLRMRQGETSSAFYDRLSILVRAACKTFTEMGDKNDQGEKKDLTEEQQKAMSLPLQQTALGTFIRGLPVDIAKAVVLKGCKTLDEAREEAVNYECKMDSKLLPDTRHKVRPDNPYGWEKEEFSSNYTWDSRPSRQDGRKHIFEIFSQQDDDLNNETVYPTTAGYSQDLGEYFSYPPDINGYGEIANSDPNEYVYIGQIHQQGTQYPSQNMNHAGVRQNYGQSGNPQRNMGYPNPGRQYQQDPRLFNPYERNGQGNSNGSQPNTMQARKFDPETGRPMQATYRTRLNYGAPPNHQ